MKKRKPEEIVANPGARREVTPALPRHILGKLHAFISAKSGAPSGDLAASLRKLHEDWRDEAWSLPMRAVALLLADLMDQGWDIRTDEDNIRLQPPGIRLVGESLVESKARLRKALQTGRDRQLRDSGTRQFVDRMHRVVLRSQGQSSVADIVDDGAQLAERLRPFLGLTGEKASVALKAVIDPEIEFCEEGARCGTTGLRLMDIWRYFRHTWSLEYRSTPGRQMAVLVRNAANPKRPVIGIAMLTSPVVRVRSRDDWIGWNPEPFLQRLRSGVIDPAKGLLALAGRVERSIEEIRWDDLVTPDELAVPSERTILRLEQRSAGANASRQRELEEVFSQAQEASESVRSQRDVMRGDLASVDWRAASEEVLFVRKRAETLSALLDAKRTFQSVNWASPSGELLGQLLSHPNGLRSLKTALTEVRKAGLSSQVVDLSVCGAVAPYGALLGGKLVALMMGSSEVLKAYREKYGRQIGLISSQMAGRPIVRPAELKVLTTTSLYGNGSSQYNRLRLYKKDFPNLWHDIEWRELEVTAGFGTTHLSNETVQTLREYSERENRARRINHRFGEGASPRMRQIRESLDALGINSEAVLLHATPRIMYLNEVHPGALEELLGLSKPTVSVGIPVKVIAALWRQRWLAGRISRSGVLNAVSSSGADELRQFFERNGAGAAGLEECLPMNTSDAERGFDVPPSLNGGRG